MSQCSAWLLLLVYNLWSLFVRVVKNQSGHTEAITSRYELLLIPAKLACSGRQKSSNSPWVESSRASLSKLTKGFLSGWAELRRS